MGVEGKSSGFISCGEHTTVPTNKIFEKSILLLVGTTIIPRMMILDLLFHNNIIRCASLQGKESARPSIWERSIEKEREGKVEERQDKTLSIFINSHGPVGCD